MLDIIAALIRVKRVTFSATAASAAAATSEFVMSADTFFMLIIISQAAKRSLTGKIKLHTATHMHIHMLTNTHVCLLK